MMKGLKSFERWDRGGFMLSNLCDVGLRLDIYQLLVTRRSLSSRQATFKPFSPIFLVLEMSNADQEAVASQCCAMGSKNRNSP